MTREEQLKFCTRCLNRRMDLQQGLICSLTGQKAAFVKDCPDFKQDESVKEKPLDDKEGLLYDEIRSLLPVDVYEKLRLEQNLIKGMHAGIVVGLIGSMIWGLITVSTGFQIGYMALAIGAGVGFSIRYMSKGIDQIFGIGGAVIALSSCILGNFLSIIGFIANNEGLGYIETLFFFNYELLPIIMAEIFSFIDLLFYGIAIFEGYKFSFRLITEKDITELTNSSK